MKNYGTIGPLFPRPVRFARIFHTWQATIRPVILLPILFFTAGNLFAQCPPNLGFEMGNFGNWTCYAGKIDSVTRLVGASTTKPLANRHVILKNQQTPALDPYGGFPVNCPNGSNYSIRLGNDSTGAQVDAVSYSITIPADKNVYSIIYNYAVVLQNPNHTASQQPRFTAKVFDVSSNQYIECSSFDFSASANLPGFKLANGVNVRGTSVYYKPWSPITIKLIGYAGRTLKLEFTTNDCTLGGHFGYAYLDINEDCSTPIKGNVFCEGTTSTVLTGPFGFKEYRWYTGDFSSLLGTENVLGLASPLPAPGTVFALEVFPFPGSGCVDTLYTTLERSSAPFVFKAVDSTGACPPLTVDLTSPQITVGSTPGLAFSYYADSSQVNYLPSPSAVAESNRYYIKAANAAGCIGLRPVAVTLDTVPEFKTVDPSPYYYPNKGDLTNSSIISGEQQGLTFSYWLDAATTMGVADPKALDVAGTYYIKGKTKYGCAVTKPVRIIIQIPPPPNIFSPNSDGVNDTWVIPALSVYPTCQVDIYDRYGRLVFHSTGYNNAWNGRFNGKALPVGTYYYVIRANDKLDLLSGSVTIIL